MFTHDPYPRIAITAFQKVHLHVVQFGHVSGNSYYKVCHYSLCYTFGVVVPRGRLLSFVPSSSSFSFQRRTCSSRILRNKTSRCSIDSCSRSSGSTYISFRISLRIDILALGREQQKFLCSSGAIFWGVSAWRSNHRRRRG